MDFVKIIPSLGLGLVVGGIVACFWICNCDPCSDCPDTQEPMYGKVIYIGEENGIVESYQKPQLKEFQVSNKTNLILNDFVYFENLNEVDFRIPRDHNNVFQHPQDGFHVNSHIKQYGLNVEGDDEYYNQTVSINNSSYKLMKLYAETVKPDGEIDVVHDEPVWINLQDPIFEKYTLEQLSEDPLVKVDKYFINSTNAWKINGKAVVFQITDANQQPH